MQAHPLFIRQLEEAARRGDDLLPILEQNRAHILACPECRAKLALFEQDLIAGEMARLEEEGRLAQPGGQPALNLDFLLAQPPTLWKRGPGADGPLRVLAFGPLLVWLEGGATFGGLPAGISAQAGGEQAARQRDGASIGAGESALLLPDAETGVEVRLQARSNRPERVDLTVTIRQGGAPVADARVRLAGSSGSQISHARQGVVAFQQVRPGRYTLEIRLLAGSLAGHAWSLAFEVRAEGAGKPPA
jgi:uncharacterized protein YbaR (Trm112 family)